MAEFVKFTVISEDEGPVWFNVACVTKFGKSTREEAGAAIEITDGCSALTYHVREDLPTVLRKLGVNE